MIHLSQGRDCTVEDVRENHWGACVGRQHGTGRRFLDCALFKRADACYLLTRLVRASPLYYKKNELDCAELDCAEDPEDRVGDRVDDWGEDRASLESTASLMITPALPP